MKKNQHLPEAGGSLVELMMTVCVSAIFIAVTAGAIGCLRHSFLASQEYGKAKADQRRALDYVSRDVRQATVISIAANQQSVTLTLPDLYTEYDAFGNPTGPMRAPTISGGSVTYGDPLKPVTVKYSVDANALYREETWYKNGQLQTKKLVICSGVEGLVPRFTGDGSEVNVSFQMAPRFGLAQGIANGAPSTISESIAVRNAFIK